MSDALHVTVTVSCVLTVTGSKTARTTHRSLRQHEKHFCSRRLASSSLVALCPLARSCWSACAVDQQYQSARGRQEGPTEPDSTK